MRRLDSAKGHIICRGRRVAAVMAVVALQVSFDILGRNNRAMPVCILDEGHDIVFGQKGVNTNRHFIWE